MFLGEGCSPHGYYKKGECRDLSKDTKAKKGFLTNLAKAWLFLRQLEGA